MYGSHNVRMSESQGTGKLLCMGVGVLGCQDSVLSERASNRKSLSKDVRVSGSYCIWASGCQGVRVSERQNVKVLKRRGIRKLLSMGVMV